MTISSSNWKNPVFGPFWALFLNFGAKKNFPENLALSRTTSYEFLATFQISEKTNDTIPRKLHKNKVHTFWSKLFFKNIFKIVSPNSRKCFRYITQRDFSRKLLLPFQKALVCNPHTASTFKIMFNLLQNMIINVLIQQQLFPVSWSYFLCQIPYLLGIKGTTWMTPLTCWTCGHSLYLIKGSNYLIYFAEVRLLERYKTGIFAFSAKMCFF